MACTRECTYIQRTCVPAAELLESERNMNTKKMLNEWKLENSFDREIYLFIQ